MTSELSEQQREVVLLLLNQGASAERERIVSIITNLEDDSVKADLISEINGEKNG